MSCPGCLMNTWCRNTVAMPKSEIFRLSLASKRRFSGLISRWAIPLPCRYSTPAISCLKNLWASIWGMPTSGSTIQNTELVPVNQPIVQYFINQCDQTVLHRKRIPERWIQRIHFHGAHRNGWCVGPSAPGGCTLPCGLFLQRWHASLGQSLSAKLWLKFNII